MSLQTVLQLVPQAKTLQFKVSVLNPSNRYEIFQRMSCSWEDNWRCDKPGIALGSHSCLSNMGQTIILPPGSAHHEEVWYFVFGRLKPGKATFRLGLVRQRSDFTSEELEQIYNSRECNTYFFRGDIARRYKRERDLFWSNQVVATVRSEWLPR